jgi:hypothetical protein
MLPCGPREIAALSEKYRLLVELRRARERGEPPPPRAVFRDLASRFPGALRELDRMPMATLERRIAELADASSGGATREWMAAHAGYHELLRFALAHKLARAHGRAPPVMAPPQAADREFLEQLRAAPGGRMVPLARGAIARVLAREVADVVALLEG